MISSKEDALRLQEKLLQAANQTNTDSSNSLLSEFREMVEVSLSGLPVEYLATDKFALVDVLSLRKAGIDTIHQVINRGTSLAHLTKKDPRIIDRAAALENSFQVHYWPDPNTISVDLWNKIFIEAHRFQQPQKYSFSETLALESQRSLEEALPLIQYLSEHDTNLLGRLFKPREVKEGLRNAKGQLSALETNFNTRKDQAIAQSKDLEIEAISLGKKDPQGALQSLILTLGWKPSPSVTSLIKGLSDALVRLKDSYDEDLMDAEILSQWKLVRLEETTKALKDAPLNLVSSDETYQAELKQLDEKRFYWAQDVLKMSQEAFSQRSSLEPDASLHFYATVENYGEKAQKSSFPRFEVDHLSQAQKILLNQLYLRRKISEFIAAHKETFDRKVEAVIALLASAKSEGISPWSPSLLLNPELHQKLSELSHLRLNLSDETTKTPNWPSLVSDFQTNSAAYYAILEKIDPTFLPAFGNDLPTYVLEKVQQTPINLTGLKGTLRPYQEFGAKYALTFGKTLLGDEMGLGKTIQALAMLNHQAKEGKVHSLVIAPLSVLSNWRREMEKWTDLSVFVFHGARRELEKSAWRNDGGVLLTTYEHSLKLDKHDEKLLNNLVVDEAHFVKNLETKRSKSVYALANAAQLVLFMTGTPLENRLKEMNQLISILNPKLSEQLREDENAQVPADYRRKVAPVYLRRLRTEVLRELPEIQFIEQYSKFSEKEQKYYDEALKQGMNGLMMMRRAGYYGQTPEESGKIAQLMDLIDQAKENQRKVLVFSFFKIVLNALKELLGEVAMPVLSGEIPTAGRQKIIDEFTSSNDAHVLLAQIEAGGVGLNIQAASVVILCEPQWKPSTENQAISRVYRMGQTRDVLVYRLLTEDAIDETMMELLGTKEQLFKDFANESTVAQAFHEKTTLPEVDSSTVEKKVLEIESQRLAQRQASVTE